MEADFQQLSDNVLRHANKRIQEVLGDMNMSSINNIKTTEELQQNVSQLQEEKNIN